jgi:chromosome segregation ATPase
MPQDLTTVEAAQNAISQAESEIARLENAISYQDQVISEIERAIGLLSESLAQEIERVQRENDAEREALDAQFDEANNMIYELGAQLENMQLLLAFYRDTLDALTNPL